MRNVIILLPTGSFKCKQAAQGLGFDPVASMAINPIQAGCKTGNAAAV